MRQSQIGYFAMSPRLKHVRMYANHVGYNALVDLLEDNKLGWKSGSALFSGKRFLDGIMSRAFF